MRQRFRAVTTASRRAFSTITSEKAVDCFVTEKDGRVIREKYFVTEYDDHGRIFRESEYRIENGEEHLVSCSEYEYSMIYLLRCLQIVKKVV